MKTSIETNDYIDVENYIVVDVIIYIVIAGLIIQLTSSNTVYIAHTQAFLGHRN